MTIPKQGNAGRFDKVGTNYELNATAPGPPGSYPSDPFDISIDCRNASSALSPMTIASTSGANG